MSLFTPLINAITGSSGTTGVSSILSAGTRGQKLGSGTSAVANIQRTLDTAKADAGKQQIMAAVQLRIQGIVQGLVEPREVWEKVAGFSAITGQPFTYTVDNAGQIEVQSQTVDDLSFVNPGQREAMRAALNRLDEVRSAVDTVVTKANLRSTLTGAISRIDQLERHAPADAQWERDFQNFKKLGRPVLVGLSPDGSLRAINQLESNFDYVEDPAKRLKLQAAGRELTNILNGTSSATKSWHYAALGNKLEKDDYFLDVDSNNEIVVRRNRDRRGVSSIRPLYQQAGNSDFHIIPEFLKPTSADNRIFKANWEREAAALIQAKKPFHLEIQGDRVIVRETNFASVRRLDILNSVTGGAARVGQATVNIIS